MKQTILFIQTKNNKLNKFMMSLLLEEPFGFV